MNKERNIMTDVQKYENKIKIMAFESKKQAFRKINEKNARKNV